MRAWADNNFDTGMVELLTIHIIDPCLESIIKPKSPLPLLTYYIGSVVTGYDVQAISEPQFHSPTALCGGVGFTAEHYNLIEIFGPIEINSVDSIVNFNFDGTFTI